MSLLNRLSSAELRFAAGNGQSTWSICVEQTNPITLAHFNVICSDGVIWSNSISNWPTKTKLNKSIISINHIWEIMYVRLRKLVFYQSQYRTSVAMSHLTGSSNNFCGIFLIINNLPWLAILKTSENCNYDSPFKLFGILYREAAKFTPGETIHILNSHSSLWVGNYKTHETISNSGTITIVTAICVTVETIIKTKKWPKIPSIKFFAVQIALFDSILHQINM